MCGWCLKKIKLRTSRCHHRHRLLGPARRRKRRRPLARRPAFPVSEPDRALPARAPRPSLGEEEVRSQGRPAGEPNGSGRQADAVRRQRLKARLPQQYVVDGGPARIILATLVTSAAVMENSPMLDLWLAGSAFAGLCERSKPPVTLPTRRWRTSRAWNTTVSRPTFRCPIGREGPGSMASKSLPTCRSETCTSARRGKS